MSLLNWTRSINNVGVSTPLQSPPPPLKRLNTYWVTGQNKWTTKIKFLADTKILAILVLAETLPIPIPKDAPYQYQNRYQKMKHFHYFKFLI
jgi:hypothetical protein